MTDKAGQNDYAYTRSKIKLEEAQLRKRQAVCTEVVYTYIALHVNTIYYW